MAYLTSPEINVGTNAGYASALTGGSANTVLNPAAPLDNLTYTTFLADIALATPVGGGTRSAPV